MESTYVWYVAASMQILGAGQIYPVECSTLRTSHGKKNSSSCSALCDNFIFSKVSCWGGRGRGDGVGGRKQGPFLGRVVV